MDIRITVESNKLVESIGASDLVQLKEAIEERIEHLLAVAKKNPIKSGEKATDYVRRMRETGGTLSYWKAVYDIRYEYKG